MAGDNASPHPDPQIAGMGMLDLVDEVKRVREQRDDLRAENGELRLEAGGLTEDGRTVPDLVAEVERLRDGIRQHRRAKTPKTPEARRAYGLPNFADQGLWALLDDREETT